jgi:putative membrane protein
MTKANMTGTDAAEYRGIAFAARSVVGGALMGLANLVPGISGGTMLLATGVYPQFISGVAEVTTFRFRARTIIMLALIAGAAFVAIVAFASLVSELVIDHRWIMYSVFIGLTLGGVPVLWRMVKPADPVLVFSSIIGIALMAALALYQPGEAAAHGDQTGVYAMLVLAGIAGGAAMILPGLSGAYLLLVLGQYLTILAAIDLARQGVSDRDTAVIAQAMHVFIPVGIGVVLGIVGLSNLMKLLLEKAQRPTLGVLLGLLLGAVFGLWPFQQPVQPEVGQVIKGVELTSPAMVDAIAHKDWPTAFFTPSTAQIIGALCLIATGFAVSMLIARLGRNGNGQVK